MRSLRRNRRIKQSGYSLVLWVAVLALIVASGLFIRTTLKRTLQGKVRQVTDYMFWSRWLKDDGVTRWTPQEYKGETNSVVKTETTQNIHSKQSEKDGMIQSNIETVVPSTENTISTSVEEGSEPVLKTFDVK